MKKAVTYQHQGKHLVLQGASRLVSKEAEINAIEILELLNDMVEFEYFIRDKQTVVIQSNVNEVYEACTALFNLTNCYHIDALS